MNILIYYDGSPQSKRAIETGINMGKNFNAKLHLMTSIELYEASTELVASFPKVEEGHTPHLAREIGAITHLVEEARLPFKIYILNRGKSPGEHIVDFAEQLNAEYIVMGANGVSRLHKIGFGRTLLRFRVSSIHGKILHEQ